MNRKGIWNLQDRNLKHESKQEVRLKHVQDKYLYDRKNNIKGIKQVRGTRTYKILQEIARGCLSVRSNMKVSKIN